MGGVLRELGDHNDLLLAVVGVAIRVVGGNRGCVVEAAGTARVRSDVIGEVIADERRLTRE